tara:strand:- start:377 stop:754 length:378 start_codon:yes stop_codon:yes gene_type:complete
MPDPRNGQVPYIKTLMYHEQVKETLKPALVFKNIIKIQVIFQRDAFNHEDLPGVTLTNYPYNNGDIPFMGRPDIYEMQENAEELCTTMIYLDGVEFSTDYHCLISQIALADIWYCVWKNCGVPIK